MKQIGIVLIAAATFAGCTDEATESTARTSVYQQGHEQLTIVEQSWNADSEQRRVEVTYRNGTALAVAVLDEADALTSEAGTRLFEGVSAEFAAFLRSDLTARLTLHSDTMAARAGQESYSHEEHLADYETLRWYLTHSAMLDRFLADGAEQGCYCGWGLCGVINARSAYCCEWGHGCWGDCC